MGLFIENSASVIKNWLISNAQEGCNTTLYEGDERRIFIESVITPIFVSLYNVIDDVAKQKMRKYARGGVLDAIGGDMCPRLQAKPAQTKFRFYVNEVAAGNIIIPAGTRISTNNDLYFVTDEECVIKQGMTEVEVSGYSAEGGAVYNGFAPSSVCVIVDNVNGVDGCENIVTTYGGDDGEPYDTQGDNRYRERIRLYEDSFSTCGSENGYRYYALSADSSIADVKILTSEEVGGPEEYDILIYAICYSGIVPNEEIVKAIHEKCDAKDARPMCEKILVSAATQIPYDIELTYYVSAADEEKAIALIEGERGVIVSYANEQDIAIAQPINPDTLFSRIMRTEDENGKTLDIRRCIINQPVYQELDYNQVAHFSGNMVIKHEVII